MEFMPAKAYPRFLRLLVLKLERSRDVRLSHPKNISNMVVTFDVSQVLRLSCSRDWQPSNINDIFVTWEVSRPERSRETSPEQPEKRLLIEVTFEVSTFEIPSIEERLFISEKNPAILSVEREPSKTILVR